MLHERLGCASAVVLLAACTVSNDENPFDTSSPTAVTVASSASTMSEDESGGASSESGVGTDGGSSSEGEGSESGMMGSTSTTTADGSSSEGAVDPTDGQPADGMYSMCTAPADCGNVPIFCITDADATDGFCTETGCTNPDADCDPSPGGTAMPVCVGPFEIQGADEMGCALSCAGGLVCPTGMVCMNFTDLGMICM
jgi:hypothetical protein